ncbi:hypothetical protein BO71DRAFT_82844 [Aspergillus ellipticus CBS 707.79]|uniref:Uncharacterized protein n=1 Tax=Aspergillus ellipticus CBS 707.79 TaxID=1448320 RepID=A0A319CZN5_9EURO|nr:hypothetical protein BO71DRAFT_82844 [Aspergillus ellipticus CBS 707.79]
MIDNACFAPHLEPLPHCAEPLVLVLHRILRVPRPFKEIWLRVTLVGFFWLLFLVFPRPVSWLPLTVWRSMLGSKLQPGPVCCYPARVGHVGDSTM